MIYTIGHSNHPIEHFLGLLTRHGLTAVADVRSSPYSRFNPQFNREKLRASLAGEGTDYMFLGKELGARSKDPACYQDGRVSYRKLAATPLFQNGLARVLADAGTHRVALMCAERDPLQCHRTILVARELVRRGETVAHLLGDGSLETHDGACARLRCELGISANDLFRSEEELSEEAYDVQGRKIAYAMTRQSRR